MEGSIFNPMEKTRCMCFLYLVALYSSVKDFIAVLSLLMCYIVRELFIILGGPWSSFACRPPFGKGS